ncbi:MAG: hypothetical protein EBT95_08500, partial [Verrucomicrobia bacterium]|nr:hypothetical protein [Verrucomicrobiota bacterium]
VPPTSAGNYTVIATVAEDANYNQASSSPTAFTIAKGTLVLSGITATGITQGQTLSASTITGTAKNAAGANVAGTWSYQNPSNTPSVGTGNHNVVFRPSDSDNYNSANDTVSVTVTPASSGGTTSALLVANFNDISSTPNDVQYQTGLPIVSGALPNGWDKEGPDPVSMVNYGTTAANWAVMIQQANSITLTSGINANESGVAYRVSFDLGATVGSKSGSATQSIDRMGLRVVDNGNDWVASAEIAPGDWTGTQTFTRRSFNYMGTGSGPVRLRVEDTSFSAVSARFVGAMDNIAITPFTENLISGPTKIAATTTIPLNGGVGAVSEIVDGLDLNSDGTGGFGPNASTGVIILTLDKAYDLESFILASGIGGSGDGINPFNLVFKNAAGAVILRKDGLNATSSGGMAEEIIFSSPIPGVKEVNLEIVDVRLSRIEIREVAFRSVPSTASVTKTTPTISAAPSASTIIYGQSLSLSTLTGGTTSVPGTFAFKTPSTAPNAGVAQNFKVIFTPTDTASYELVEIDVPVTVNKAPLTIKAEDKQRRFGENNPPLTLTYTGFVLGQDATALEAQASASTEANNNSDRGGYDIVVEGGSSANYAITRESGRLEVIWGQPVVTKNPAASTLTYGQTLLDSLLTGGEASV